MVNLNSVEYPQRLCVEMLSFCVLSNEKTQHMTASEIKKHLSIFFSEEMINNSVKMLTGDETQ